MTRLGRVLAWLAAAACVAAASADDTATRTLTSESKFRIELPWTSRWVSDPGPQVNPQTVGIVVVDDPQAMRAMVSVLGPIKPEKLTEETVLGLMRKTIENLAAQSVEQDLVPVAIEGGRHRGWYFIATDKEPEPDEYEYFCGVYVMTTDSLILATILFNDSGKADALKLRDALPRSVVTLP